MPNRNTVCPQRILKEAGEIISLLLAGSPVDDERADNCLQELQDLSRALPNKLVAPMEARS